MACLREGGVVNFGERLKMDEGKDIWYCSQPESQESPMIAKFLLVSRMLFMLAEGTVEVYT